MLSGSSHITYLSLVFLKINMRKLSEGITKYIVQLKYNKKFNAVNKLMEILQVITPFGKKILFGSTQSLRFI